MCLFCDIVAGKQKAEIIFQDQDIVAFSDIKPKAPVHILVVPRKHIESLQALEKEDIILVGKLIFQAKELAQKKGISEAYKLVFNGGRLQQISHLHLHLLGGWKRGEKISEV